MKHGSEFPKTLGDFAALAFFIAGSIYGFRQGKLAADRVDFDSISPNTANLFIALIWYFSTLNFFVVGGILIAFEGLRRKIDILEKRLKTAHDEARSPETNP